MQLAACNSRHATRGMYTPIGVYKYYIAIRTGFRKKPTGRKREIDLEYRIFQLEISSLNFLRIVDGPGRVHMRMKKPGVSNHPGILFTTSQEC